MEIITLISLVLGIWGTILSTALAIIKIFERSISIDVKVIRSLTRYSRTIKNTISIEGVNKGKRPIRINGFGFLLPKDDRALYIIDPLYIEPRLPAMLKDGEGIIIVMDVKDIIDNLIEEGYKNIVAIQGFLSTPSKKKRIISKSFDVDINYWKKKLKNE